MMTIVSNPVLNTGDLLVEQISGALTTQTWVQVYTYTHTQKVIVKWYINLTVVLISLYACMLNCFSRVWLFATPCTVAHKVPGSKGFSGCHALLRGIFMTQRSNQRLSLLHWQAGSLPLATCVAPFHCAYACKSSCCTSQIYTIYVKVKH